MGTSIPDWIEAIVVFLGIPVVIWSNISLFIKDKDKARKIESLQSIAKNQESVAEQLSLQVEQLVKQSSHLQYQNVLMNEANQLLVKQIELQEKRYITTSGFEKEKAELEAKRRLLSIKPYFVFETNYHTPEHFCLTLRNKGEIAKKLRLSIIENEDVFIADLNNDLSTEHNQCLVIAGYPKNNTTVYTFEVALLFKDIDNNLYFQSIRRDNDGKFIIQEPRFQINDNNSVK